MADLQRNSIPTPCLMVPFWIEHALLRKGKPLDVLFNYAEIKSIFSMEDLVALATINEDDTLPLAEIVPTESRLTQQWKASAEKPSGLLDRTITLATGLADTRRRLSTVDGVVDPATVLKIVHSPTSNIVYVVMHKGAYDYLSDTANRRLFYDQLMKALKLRYTVAELLGCYPALVKQWMNAVFR